MRTLVTGGAGFIGSHLVDRLLDRGDEVVVLDNLDPQVHADREVPRNLTHRLDNPGLRFVRGDVRDQEAVEGTLDGVEAVVHLAAAVGVGQSMYRPSYFTDVNVAGQGRIMESMARRAGSIHRFVVASSMSIYGEGAYECVEHASVFPRPRPVEQLANGCWEPLCPVCRAPLEPRATAEGKPTQDTSIYAVTKKAQEELALSFGRAYGLPTAALRFFNVYGSRQALSNPYTGIAAIFMSRLKNGNPPLLFEDGLQSRDFIHVADVADAVLAALDGDVVGAFNVCTGRPTPIGAVASALAKRMGVALEPTVIGRYRAGDIRHCYGDPTRAMESLRFRSRVGLEEGLDELLAWASREAAADRVESGIAELEGHGLVR